MSRKIPEHLRPLYDELTVTFNMENSAMKLVKHIKLQKKQSNIISRLIST